MTTVNVAPYDPFARGPFPVGLRTIDAPDATRGRVFPCDVWYPARNRDEEAAGRDAAALPASHPLILYSHHSGGNRRAATFLCRHLAGHGYVVAAADHSEVVATDLGPQERETAAERTARIERIVASRVPDLSFLLGHLLDGHLVPDAHVDANRIGLVGHSLGGWTVLATPDVEPRVGAVVALAPGGSSRPMPGVLALTLAFGWGRDVPALVLAAGDDVPIPLDRVAEVFERIPGSARMFVLHRADHQHFLDDVAGGHEAVRSLSLAGDAAWIPGAMRPIAELCPGGQAHTFTRGLTLAHLDEALRRNDAAARFLAGAVEAALAAQGVAASAHRRQRPQPSA